MKRILSTILAAVLCPVFCAYAQDIQTGAGEEYEQVAVSISKDKIKKDGKVYYSHVVLERQTLYSISKAYNVTLDEIYEANPSLRENGLKKNSIIMIPVSGPEKTTPEKASPEKVNSEKESPEKDKSRKDGKGGKSKDYFIHTVKWYEDLEAIAKKYDVPAQAIIKFNDLTSNKLTKRQKLKIPTNPDEVLGIALEELEDTVSPSDTSYVVEAIPTPKEKVSALLMLPFNASSTEPNQMSLDFYSGALLAVKNLGEDGLEIDLSVYDTHGDNLPITQERMEASDFVIGPFSLTSLTALLEKAPDNLLVISPLDQRTASLTGENPNFVQVPTPSSRQYFDLARWISEEKTASDSVIVIYEKGTAGSRIVSGFIESLDSCRVSHSTFSYNILEGRSIQDQLSHMMSKTGHNRIVVASESEAFVNDVIRNLNLLIHQKYGIVLYAASRTRTFETIDVENMHATSMHLSLPYYIDYDSQDVRDFILKYRALYNAEPSQTAYQGYDIMHYFASMTAKYGPAWNAYLTGESVQMLMSDMEYAKNGEGYIRTSLRRIVYEPDYSIKWLKYSGQ